LAELDIVRCLRAVFSFNPDDDYKRFYELVDSLKEKMVEKGIPENLCNKLYSLLTKKYSIKYSGTGQYGVPNYSFFYNGERINGDSEFTAMVQVIKERINTVKNLIDLAKEKLCFFVYIEA